MMKFEWLTDWDDIWSDDFLSQWHGWMENSENSHVFFHPAMVKAWVDTYRPIRDIRPLFCIASDGCHTVFFPLVLWKKNWKNAFVRTIVPAGHSDFDYHTPVVTGDIGVFDSSFFWDELEAEIDRKWHGRFDMVELTGVEGPFATGNGWKEVDESPRIDLAAFPSYEALMKTLKSKERGDINRQQRRLRELGKFEYRVYAPEETAAALAALPEMLRHHAQRWPNAYKAPGYHANLVRNALPEGLMHFSQITVNDETVCWNLSFRYRKCYYFYMPAYVEKYRKYSPGKVNMYMSIAQMFEDGCEIFDLLRGAEDYKGKLPVTVMKIYDRVYNSARPVSGMKRFLMSLKKRIR